MQVDLLVALMGAHIFLQDCAGMSSIGYCAGSGYNMDGISMLRLVGRMAEVSVALARNMPMRLRHVDVRETFVSCAEAATMLLFKKLRISLDSSCAV